MDISFAEPSVPGSGTVVVGIFQGGTLAPSAAQLDRRTGGALSRAVATSQFRGKRGESRDVFAPPRTKLERVVLLGLGDPDAFDALAAQAVGGAACAVLSKAAAATIMVDPVPGGMIDEIEAAANIAFGVELRAYRFDKYRTKLKEEQKPRLKRLAIHVKGAAAARKSYAPLRELAAGVYLTRDLVSEPANIIYPVSLAERAIALRKIGVGVESLDEKQMAKLGMGALLGVAQGSVQKPRLVVMRWMGAERRDAQPIAFIGKGVTFDTGGISIKPANQMWDMKWDMAGAGVVVGLMRALAGRKAKVNAVGVIALVENMPSGSAQRPGDIVTSMSGQTIEVLNTDAEGRLILADALWYTQDRFKPRFMVNLATLTGAIITALGHLHAGLFSNNDELSERLVSAGKASEEHLWRMPLSEGYDKLIDSDAADMKNIGDGGAGSITGAQFIQRFVNNVPWAHLDIAGVAWSKKDAPTVPKGGTAFGVRLLNQLVADHYEEL